MKKTVIIKGPFIDSIEEDVLREYLDIMFTECNVEIRLDTSVNSLNEEIYAECFGTERQEKTWK